MDERSQPIDDVRLTKQIAEILGRVPGWSWADDPDAPDYPNTVVGIRYGAILPTPIRTIGVRVYWSADDDQKQDASPVDVFPVKR